MKKFRSLFLIICCAVFTASFLCACNKNNMQDDNGKIKVMTTIFPIYDMCREITNGVENVEISWLLDNGVDLHNFNPSATDIINIGKQDLFFYIGGESDEWVNDVKVKGKKYAFMNELADMLKKEEFKEGMEGEAEEEEAYDEHIWLSLNIAKYMAIHIEKELSKIDTANCNLYESNLDNFLTKIKALDESYSKIFATRDRKIMLFADRFPFRYLCDDYGIEYFAAFMGCSAETEASFKTIRFLTDKVDEYNLKTIWVLESSDKKIADTIIENAANKDVHIASLDSMQSVNRIDALDGESYINIMSKNLDALKEEMKK